MEVVNCNLIGADPSSFLAGDRRFIFLLAQHLINISFRFATLHASPIVPLLGGLYYRLLTVAIPLNHYSPLLN